MHACFTRAETVAKATVGVVIAAIDIAIVGYWLDALLNDVTVWSNLDGSLRGVHFLPSGWFVPWSDLTLQNSECRMMESIPATVLATTGATIFFHLLMLLGAAVGVRHPCMIKLTMVIIFGSVVTTMSIGVAMVMPIWACHKHFVIVRYPQAMLLDTPLDMAWVAVLWPVFVIFVLVLLFYIKRWLVRRGYVPITHEPLVVDMDMQVL